MDQSQDTGALFAALAVAQGEISDARKDRANPHLKVKYATLESVLDELRPVWSRHGLAIVQAPSLTDGIVSVDTQVCHASGQWLRSRASCPLGEQRGVTQAQAVGIVISYLRRYSAMAIAGIVGIDDDTDGEHRHLQREQAPPQREPAQQAPPQAPQPPPDPLLSPEGANALRRELGERLTDAVSVWGEPATWRQSGAVQMREWLRRGAPRAMLAWAAVGRAGRLDAAVARWGQPGTWSPEVAAEILAWRDGGYPDGGAR